MAKRVRIASLPKRWQKFWPVRKIQIGGGKSARRVRKDKRQKDEHNTADTRYTLLTL